MRKFIILVVVVLSCLPMLAQDKAVTLSPSFTKQEVSRNFRLERAALTRTNRLKKLLHSETKARLDIVTKELIVHLASGSRSIDIGTFTQQGISNKFTRLSNEQSNLLSFYVLAEAARILGTPNELKKLDSMNEMSEMNSLRLQMTIDRRSKFISTLSNIMKKISTTQDTLVQNIK